MEEQMRNRRNSKEEERSKVGMTNYSRGTCRMRGGASQANTTPAEHVQITPLTPVEQWRKFIHMIKSISTANYLASDWLQGN